MWEAITSWTSVITVLVVCVTSLLLYMWWQSQRDFWMFRKLGIPGPKPGLLMGNTRELLKNGFFTTYAQWAKEYGKVFGISVTNLPLLVVTDPDLLRELMVKKFPSFHNRTLHALADYKPWKYDLIRLRDDHWKHVRSILSPTFSSGKLRKMMPTINRVMQNFDKNVGDKAEKGEAVELKDLAGAFAMDTIAGATFGIQVDSLSSPNDPFIVNAKGLMNQRGWLLAVAFFFPKLGILLRHIGINFISPTATNFFIEIVQLAFKERRQELNTKKFTDFLQLLVDAQKETHHERGPVDAEIDFTEQLTTSKDWHNKALTDDEATANAIIFLLAGYETTSTVLSLTLFHIAAHPEVLQKAQEEVDSKLGKDPVTYETASQLTYLDMCMNETMRLFPPGFVLNREADEDTTLGDYPVKKGMQMVIPVCAIHRNAEYFPDPEKFDPERFTPEAKAARHPFVFLPFGMGPRNCIGMRLAQLEVRMAIATVLQHYTPVFCDKSVYPPVLKPPQIRIAFNDGLWVKFKSRT